MPHSHQHVIVVPKTDKTEARERTGFEVEGLLCLDGQDVGQRIVLLRRRHRGIVASAACPAALRAPTGALVSALRIASIERAMPTSVAPSSNSDWIASSTPNKALTCAMSWTPHNESPPRRKKLSSGLTCSILSNLAQSPASDPSSGDKDRIRSEE